MITVTELGPGRWLVTRVPTWLGRLFGRVTIQTEVQRCPCDELGPGCYGICYSSTGRHVPGASDAHEWVVLAVEQRQVSPMEEAPLALAPARLLALPEPRPKPPWYREVPMPLPPGDGP
jgi:hypothetical protein